MSPSGMHTRPARGWMLLLLAGLLPGCEIGSITVDEPRTRVIAEIYLRVTNGVPDAVALLHQTGTRDALPLLQARVRIRGADGTVAEFSGAPLAACVEGLVPPEFDARCLRLQPPAATIIRPGGSYTAEVLFPAGERIHGEVTLPGEFQILAPNVGSAVCLLLPGNLLPVRWSEAEGARAYLPEAEIWGLESALAPVGIEVPTEPVVLLGLAVSQQDTEITFPSQFGVFNRFSNDRAVLLALRQGLPTTGATNGEVIVSAQDRNSVNWNRGGNFNPSGTVRIPSMFGDGTGVVAGVVNRGFAFSSEDQGGSPPCL